MAKTLLAIDPSLTASGWALFGLERGDLQKLGAMRAPGAELPLAERLSSLQRLVKALVLDLQLGEGDILLCEGPAPLVLNPMSALKVERVRSIFESVARTHGVLVPGRLNPRTVQTELLGLRGKQLARKDVKQIAMQIATQLYGKQLDQLAKKAGARRLSQDMVDAVLVGTLALTRIRGAQFAGRSIEEAFLPKVSTSSGRKLRWTKSDLKVRKAK